MSASAAPQHSRSASLAAAHKAGLCAGTQKARVALRGRLPRQPASSAGEYHGPTDRVAWQSPCLPAALDPVRGRRGRPSRRFELLRFRSAMSSSPRHLAGHPRQPLGWQQ
jgi:hypothetical protein